MYSKRIFVGKEFKLPFFKTLLHLKKVKDGWLYFNNDELLKKLRLKGRIEYLDAFGMKNEVEELKKQMKSLVECITEINEAFEEENDHKNRDLLFLKREASDQEKRILKIDSKFETLLEILSEKIANNERFPDVFAHDFTIDSFAKNRSFTNVEKTLFSMLCIMKKWLTDKGMKA